MATIRDIFEEANRQRDPRESESESGSSARLAGSGVSDVFDNRPRTANEGSGINRPDNNANSTESAHASPASRRSDESSWKPPISRQPPGGSSASGEPPENRGIPISAARGQPSLTENQSLDISRPSELPRLPRTIRNPDDPDQKNCVRCNRDLGDSRTWPRWCLYQDCNEINLGPQPSSISESHADSADEPPPSFTVHHTTSGSPPAIDNRRPASAVPPSAPDHPEPSTRPVYIPGRDPSLQASSEPPLPPPNQAGAMSRVRELQQLRTTVRDPNDPEQRLCTHCDWALDGSETWPRWCLNPECGKIVLDPKDRE